MTTSTDLRDAYVERAMKETCPCTDCQNAEICGYEDMACTAFVQFVLKGKFNFETPRVPSYKVFDRVFSKIDFNERDVKRLERT